MRTAFADSCNGCGLGVHEGEAVIRNPVRMLYAMGLLHISDEETGIMTSVHVVNELANE